MSTIVPNEMRRLASLVTLNVIAAFSPSLMAMDIDALWDFSQPARSEQRFRESLATATADGQLVLETQIARSYAIRRDFARARDLLKSMERRLDGASPEPRARYHLELGRTYASATHAPEQLTPDALDKARTSFLRAFDIASQARLDAVAIDALHMMPFVDTEPAKQIEWDRKAIAYMERSGQPAAKRWEGSLRNNLGYALRLAGDFDGALAQFRLSRAAYERDGRARNVRYADWMIARTYREQKRYAEALAIQLRLEREWQAAGETDPEVFEEMELLYRALGDEARARHYADRRRGP